MRFVIVTGMSGAGKSQTIKCLEDMNFYCVDNMPPVLMPKFAEICLKSSGMITNAAVVVDIRGGEMFKEIYNIIDELKSIGVNPEILFLKADDSVIVKRYKETRRMHPLSHNGKIQEGIEKEKQILAEIKNKTDYCIDTSNLTAHQLKKSLMNIFGDISSSEGLLIDVMSFGFKYGVPNDADLVFDVRFLPNPYYIEDLKMSTGMEEKVSDFVFKWQQTTEFLDKLYDMITYLVPYYQEEGKSQLVIAIGCTGGMHRSVAICEKLYEKLISGKYKVIKHHRDIGKDVKM